MCKHLIDAIIFDIGDVSLFPASFCICTLSIDISSLSTILNSSLCTFLHLSSLNTLLFCVCTLLAGIVSLSTSLNNFVCVFLLLLFTSIIY